MAAILLVAAVASWLLPTDLWRMPPSIAAQANPNVAEGSAWWQGRLDLGSRVGEIVRFEGRHYNIHPPLMSIAAFVLHPLSPGRVPGWCLLLTVGAALPFLAFLTFVRAARSSEWGAVLTVGYLFGSPLLPMLLHCWRSGSVYHVNQAVSQLGLLLLLYEYLGRRRMWVMGLGLAVGAWSRQCMILYAAAMLWAAWKPLCRPAARTPSGPREQVSASRTGAAKPVAACLVWLVVVAGVPLTLNHLKFGSPLESGYRFLDALAGDPFMPGGEGPGRGPFSLHYLPRNFYYMHLAVPRAEFVSGRLMYRGGVMGTSMWLTTPILLYCLLDVRRTWRDPDSRVLLFCAAAVMGVLLTYFNTGYAQRGYSRFTLDFVPALLVCIAPTVGGPLRRYVTPPLVAWSVLYFAWVTD